jgi:spore maturation protein CgeB
MNDRYDIAFFGSSLVSSWWNGAATYYRGIVRGLAELGHRVTFHEPIAFDRQAHRDIPDPPWATVVTYEADDEDQVRRAVERALTADVVVKTSGVGVFDDVLERAVADLGACGATTIFWDVDAPATLARLEADLDDPFRAALPRFDLVVTYGGGETVRKRYEALGAARVELVYNALDPTTHHRVDPDPRFDADLALLANRLPDREERIEEFFLRPALLLPDRRFLLAGNGWADRSFPRNVTLLGHVGTEDHNAFNCTPLAVLNVTRDSMAVNGWSPATRVFEAAGVGACLITDLWDGIDEFLAPGAEVLVAVDGLEVASLLSCLRPERARRIGEAGARAVAARHTYDLRAQQVDALLREARPW